MWYICCQPKRTTMKTKITLSLTEEAAEKLQAISDQSGISASAVVELMVRRFDLDDLIKVETALHNARRDEAILHLKACETMCGAQGAARLLGVTQSTISTWTRKEGLPFVEGRNARGYQEHALLAFFAKKYPGKRPLYASLLELRKAESRYANR